jgi:hypothetical protein
LETCPTRHSAGHFNQQNQQETNENNMKIEPISIDRFADLLEESRVIEKADHGPHTVHHAIHPALGEISLISSIVEPWLLVTT